MVGEPGSLGYLLGSMQCNCWLFLPHTLIRIRHFRLEKKAKTSRLNADGTIKGASAENFAGGGQRKNDRKSNANK